MNVVEQAYNYCRKVHRDQRYGDKPFFRHPAQVAKIIKTILPLDYELQAAAYLHDVLEDTDTNVHELVTVFDSQIAGLVYEVTKTEYNTFPNLKTRRGIILKYVDRLCNLLNIDQWDEERQKKYILKSKFWLP